MKNNFTEIVEQAGLTQPQARVYSSLLEINGGTITDIAKSAEIKRSSVYNVIEKLELLGLISKVLDGKRYHYSAVHPQRLLQLAKFKLNQIESNLPKLIGAYQSNGEKPKIQMFEGIKAVRDVYQETLNRLRGGEELLIFTNIGRVIETFPEIPKEFEKILGNTVRKSLVRELVYGDTEGVTYAQNIQNKVDEKYQVRISPTDIPFGHNEQFIFKDKIIYFALQKQIFVTIIENEDLAKTHRGMFEMAWKQAVSV